MRLGLYGRWIAGGLALAAIGATCGGDGGSFSSGLDNGAELGALSPGDADKLCQSVNDWMTNHFAKDIKELSCRTTGALAGAFGSAASQKQAACQTAYDRCMSQPSDEEPTSTSCQKPAASCKATVGELETCINELAPLLQQAVNSLPTCQQIGSGSTTTPPVTPESPASCKTLQSKCPGMSLPTFRR